MIPSEKHVSESRTTYYVKMTAAIWMPESHKELQKVWIHNFSMLRSLELSWSELLQAKAQEQSLHQSKGKWINWNVDTWSSPYSILYIFSFHGKVISKLPRLNYVPKCSINSVFSYKWLGILTFLPKSFQSCGWMLLLAVAFFLLFNLIKVEIKNALDAFLLQNQSSIHKGAKKNYLC